MSIPLLSNSEVISEEHFLEDDEEDDRIQLLTEEEDEEDELYLSELSRTGVSPFASRFNVINFKEKLSKILESLEKPKK